MLLCGYGKLDPTSIKVKAWRIMCGKGGGVAFIFPEGSVKANYVDFNGGQGFIIKKVGLKILYHIV